MVQSIVDFLNGVVGLILVWLPDSPFGSTINSMRANPPEWLTVLNWLVPVGNFIAIGSAWLAAITIFYAFQLILRWAKAVGE